MGSIPVLMFQVQISYIRFILSEPFAMPNPVTTTLFRIAIQLFFSKYDTLLHGTAVAVRIFWGAESLQILIINVSSPEKE
jgi:hypothetical protein